MATICEIESVTTGVPDLTTPYRWQPFATKLIAPPVAFLTTPYRWQPYENSGTVNHRGNRYNSLHHIGGNHHKFHDSLLILIFSLHHIGGNHSAIYHFSYLPDILTTPYRWQPSKPF